MRKLLCLKPPLFEEDVSDYSCIVILFETTGRLRHAHTFINFKCAIKTFIVTCNCAFEHKWILTSISPEKSNHIILLKTINNRNLFLVVSTSTYFVF